MNLSILMARIGLNANGPIFNLNKKDVDLLIEKNRLNFEGNSATGKNLSGRICLTEKDPNCSKSNGTFIKRDSFCESGYILIRHPENCCPFEAKNLFYTLKISKKRFEEFLFSDSVAYTHDCFNGERHFDSRCKYDRFAVHYFQF
jgi:hypothetical protein